MVDLKSFRHKLTIVFMVVSLTGFVQLAHGDIVPVSTSTPTGSGNRNGNTDFVGLVDSIVPTTVGGLQVNMNNVPGGESFAIGDIVGRDIDDSGGGRVWDYVLNLPVDAAPGTGFTDITFSAHAFENANNNLETPDELVWEMFLDGNPVAVDSGTSGNGVDFTSIDINLSNPGNATTDEILVRMTVNGFNGGGEWFAARGTLSANYETIPEPQSWMVLAIAAMSFAGIRRRRVAA